MYIGKIFVGGYPPEIADWCNANNAHLEELEKVDDLRQFKIVENAPEPVEIQIRRLESLLTRTNEIVFEAFETGGTVPENIRREREQIREQIRQLKGETNAGSSNTV